MEGDGKQNHLGHNHFYFLLGTQSGKIDLWVEYFFVTESFFINISAFEILCPDSENRFPEKTIGCPPLNL